jgi:hypothetical protein
VLTFRALAGLPAKPLPSYATLIMEGHVDLARRTGVLTTTLFAGAPQDMSDVALLGMSRVMRVVDVREQSGRVRITAVVDDRAQLRKGESAVVRVFLDLRRGTVSTRFISTPVTLRLAP